MVPGSKSYTHRMLVASALSDGICDIGNVLESEDTALTQGALAQLGIVFEKQNGRLLVHGTGGRFDAANRSLYLGNSGTSMRFVTALAALGHGTYTLDGSARMQKRPIGDLVDGLQQIGVRAHAVNHDGCPPIEVAGGNVRGGSISLDCSISSQFLSALLMIAPCTQNGIDITITRGPVSRPYIDMTIDIMNRFGIKVFREGYRHVKVDGGQTYRHGTYEVEPDCSQAGYFWAAAAITGVAVTVKGTSRQSLQGDVHLTDVFEKMGCRVSEDAEGITVCGSRLTGVDVDMADMPDMVPTLALVAAFAEGATVMRHIAHLRAKESDRLAAVATELSKMGIRAQISADDLIITGGTPHGAQIETYNDHRIAMSFALAGLRVPGVVIADSGCVKKSFPEFWNVFNTLYK